MKVSIVIPALNEEKYIGDCIRHIRQLDYPATQIEIIVVDNGSTDKTLSIVNENSVNFIIDKTASISRLRNIGAKKTESDLICFVDADVFVDRSWLKAAIGIIKTKEKLGIIGSYYGIPGKPTWIEKTWYELKKDITGEVDFLSSGNMIMRREIFNEVGGFDETVITGEDYELCQRVKKCGYIIYNGPQIKVIHMGNLKKINDIFRKERWYGLGMFSTMKNGQISKPLILSFLTILLLIFYPISLFVSFDFFLVISLLLFLIPILISIYFTRYVKKNRLIVFLKCIPISFCYILARSLSIFDVLKLKFKK